MESSLTREFKEASRLLMEHLQNGEVPKIITHNDADGLTAGAIAHGSILREGYPAQTRVVKQLEEDIIVELAKEDPRLVIFTDMGSSQLPEIKNHLLDKTFVIVIDHHQPKELEHENLAHLNPHFHGIDGAREISGAGMTYFFFKAFNKRNVDLSSLAAVGALGDIQDADGKFIGPNCDILKDGEKAGVLKAEQDLRLFGRQTRPLYKALEYTTDPFVPGLSGSESSCVQFLKDLDIPVKRGEDLTMLADLDPDERQRLVTALILKMIEHQIPPEVAEGIVGEVYTLVKEEKRTTLRDAREFATILNACGKNKNQSVGLAICLGERGEMYKRSLDFLKEHKTYLSSCYGWISENVDKIKEMDALYHFHAGDDINENVLGTVASMVLNSKVLKSVKPVIAFVNSEDGDVKVSSRGNKELIGRGLNLGKAMGYASEKLGGKGGGHNIAAGAKIKIGEEEEFLKYVDEKIKEQMQDEHS
ncbi:MAG: DHH family phosphoesterase [Candidatus Hydrothermarchaeaceae archaeon]